VLISSKESQADEPIRISPFRLDRASEQKPSFFEIIFRLDDTSYRYGFEVTSEKVETEWLFYSPHGKETKLFIREGNDIKPSRGFKGGQAAKKLTRSNALFISVSAQFNSETAINVLSWFKSVGVISGLDDSGYEDFTAKKFSEDPKFRTNILDLIKGFDVGINNVIIEQVNINDPKVFPEDMPQELKEYVIKQMKDSEGFVNFKSVHQRDCGNGKTDEIPFDMDDESEGTQKLFFLSGPIIDTLSQGKLLIIDEIEARMHTLLTRKLISMFNSEINNPNHAQLIFATQDTNLLSNKLFRRDQIWFVEKDEMGSSHLYSLAELKVRKERDYENDYLQGRYGGIPMLGEMRQTMIDLIHEDEHE
ncbi:ATP-binding protein, partial [bacterium]|nr:ATP-binding protein [bacterium]